MRSDSDAIRDVSDAVRCIGRLGSEIVDLRESLAVSDKVNAMLREMLNIYEEALRWIACPRRADGTYNHDRSSCENLANEALNKSRKVLHEP